MQLALHSKVSPWLAAYIIEYQQHLLFCKSILRMDILMSMGKRMFEILEVHKQHQNLGIEMIYVSHIVWVLPKHCNWWIGVPTFKKNELIIYQQKNQGFFTRPPRLWLWYTNICYKNCHRDIRINHSNHQSSVPWGMPFFGIHSDQRMQRLLMDQIHVKRYEQTPGSENHRNHHAPYF